MKQYKFIVLFLFLLLIPVGMVAAYASANFTTQRFVIVGGGLSDSANFSVTSVIGQQATDLANSTNYKVSGGFLFPIGNYLSQEIYLPFVMR